MSEAVGQDLIDRLLRLVELGARERAVALVRDLQDAGRPVEQIIDELLAPVQVEIGERWLRREWSVAQEHAATGIAAAALGRLELAAPTATDATGKVVLCCPEGELHAFPAALMAHLLRREGWYVHDLGASTPADAAADFAVTHDAFAVLVSCTLPAALPGAAQVINEVHNAGLPVAVGGSAFGADGSRAAAIGADGWNPDAHTAGRLLRDWRERPPVPRAADTELWGRLAEMEAAVALLCDLTMTHLMDRSPGTLGQMGDRFREALDLLVRTSIGATAVDDRALFLEQLDWHVGYLTHRNVSTSILSSALVFLSDPPFDVPATRKLYLTGLDHLEQMGIRPERLPSGDPSATLAGLVGLGHSGESGVSERIDDVISQRFTE